MLLDRSDFVSLHVPLKPETQGLIGARAFELMKPTALLINTARGPVVDHEALYRALCDGEIAGAALDVTDPEPLPADHPLLRAPNLLVVPHVGAATFGTREQMTALAVDNLLAGLDGRPMPHQANEPVDPLMRIAVVDIGTNSTRLLIADVAGGSLTELERRSIVTRLGEGVDATGALGDEPQQRVFKVLDAYAQAIEAHGCEARTAVMTSAVRDASNGAQFAATVRDRYGLEGRTLSGDEEARFTFLGASASPAADDEHPLVVIDIGGGSTELVVGRRGEVSFHVSTQVGVVRHTERHLHSDPPTAEELDALARDAGPRFEEAVPARAAPERALGDRRGGHRDAVRRDRPRARPLRPRSDRGPPAGPRHAAAAAAPARVGAAGGAQVSPRTGPRPGPHHRGRGGHIVRGAPCVRARGDPGIGARHPLGCRAGHRRTRSRHIAQPPK